MNDYTRGVFAALSWTKTRLETVEDSAEIRKEVSEVLEDISLIVAKGFRDKFRISAES